MIDIVVYCFKVCFRFTDLFRKSNTIYIKLVTFNNQMPLARGTIVTGLVTVLSDLFHHSVPLLSNTLIVRLLQGLLYFPLLDGILSDLREST
jgi:hypothetical protein